MKKLILITSTVFMMNLSQSLAVDCPNGTTLNTDCWDCGKTAGKISCSFSDGVFTISGEGNMKDWGAYASDLPWYKYNKDITSVVFTEGSNIKSLPMYTFYGAKNLTDINLPETIESIGTSAFIRTGITNIKIPEGVTRLADTLFSEATQLESITLPSTLTYISDSAFQNTYKLKEYNIPDTLTAENANSWLWVMMYRKIKCVKADGSEGGDDAKCLAALQSFIPDEDGKCSYQYKVYGSTYNGCYTGSQIGNTCVGRYFGSISGDGTCVDKTVCTRAGNYINTDTRQCVTPDSCTGIYVADVSKKKCFKMPGCVNYVDGACQECESDYLKQSGACVEASACNGRNYASGDECKEMPDGCIRMSDDLCASCDDEHLEKDGVCISASAGCGAGYRQFENFCNRIRYTPAEAAQVLRDDNTNEITITFKK